jgi:hypothetical protein
MFFLFYIGNLGNFLDSSLDSTNVYISSNGGASFRKIYDGAWLADFSSEGVLFMGNIVSRSNTLLYDLNKNLRFFSKNLCRFSSDAGFSFNQCRFYNESIFFSIRRISNFFGGKDRTEDGDLVGTIDQYGYSGIWVEALGILSDGVTRINSLFYVNQSIFMNNSSEINYCKKEDYQNITGKKKKRNHEKKEKKEEGGRRKRRRRRRRKEEG